MWIPFFLKQHEFEQEAPLLMVGDTGPSDTSYCVTLHAALKLSDSSL